MILRSRRSADSEEIGWISLVDLLVVLCCIGFLAFIAVSSEMGRAADHGKDDKREIWWLRTRVSMLERAVSDWKDKYQSASKPPDDTGAASGREQTSAKVPEPPKQLPTPDDQKRVGELEGQLAAANERMEFQRKQIVDLQGWLARLQELGEEAGRLRKDLLGITGQIGNVVFVVDRSQSMENGGRWDEAKRLIEIWISLLPVDRAALVLFGSDIRVIPSSIRLADALQPDSRDIPPIDEAGRSQMKQELENLKPEGGTPTYRALQRAMEFRDIDAIILFTDGNPDGFNGDGTAEQVHQLIAEWRTSHPQGQVHAVGIGEYFNVSMGNFLRGVARHGGGVFIGR